MSVEQAKEPLTRARILDAAVRLADASGMRAVTMRAIGDELDREAMSLYHHVADKKALIAGMVDTVVAEVAESGHAIHRGDWRSTVRDRCLEARRIMLTHPWAPSVIAQQEESPASAFALYDDLVGTVLEAGFDHALAHRAIHALGSLVLGFSNELFDPAPGGDVEPDEEAMRAMAATFPHLLEMADMELHAAEGALSMCDTQAEFEFTLGLVLDGLEARRAALA
ncbi:TetR/AcrR family transcriptional regulator [Demequina mangrovi]|uniref:Transcriptional regulator, TetR family n=1 Tax=Demequina mangrovi TaxID=1043493 RepID=A0A1H6VXL1_9MICO|nr:TetR/AcrR family transcriptional regulator [Demequina mangrovi]SEJ09363.1 transcriptional regulator, TetR family [Demequina mangrovi]